MSGQSRYNYTYQGPTRLDYNWSWLADVNDAEMGTVIIVFLLISVTLGTFFNLILTRTAFLYRKKSKFKCTAHFLITLGLVDASFSLSQGVQILTYFLQGAALTEKCEFGAILGLFLMLSEQMIYCWLILERLNSVFRPIHHHVTCPGRKVWMDVLFILVTSLTVSVILTRLTGTEFSVYRGRCWMKLDTRGQGVAVTTILTLYGTCPIFLTMVLLARVLYLACDSSTATPSTSRACGTLLFMTIVFSLSCYSEILILVLTFCSKMEARRYFLVLDSVVSLLARCLSPIAYSHALHGFTFFCLAHVDRTLFAPVWGVVAVVLATVRVRVAKLRAAMRQPRTEETQQPLFVETQFSSS